MFWRLGNKWHADDARTVLLSGLGLMLPPLALMWVFNDDKALSHHHPHDQQQQEQAGAAHAADVEGQQRKAWCRCLGASPAATVTALIVASDLIGALASGARARVWALRLPCCC